MEVAIIINDEITRLGDYRDVFPNTSFRATGPTDEFLQANNAKKVNRFKTHDALTQKLSPCQPYVDGDFVSVVQVESLTSEEIQAAKDSAMSRIRAQRNIFLKESDWSQGKDIADDISTPWAAYRQLLRDLPTTITEPRTFNSWPHDPDWVDRGDLL